MLLNQLFYAIDDLKRFPKAAPLLKDIVCGRNYDENLAGNATLQTTEDDQALSELILLCEELLTREFPTKVKTQLRQVHFGAAKKLARRHQSPLDGLAREA